MHRHAENVRAWLDPVVVWANRAETWQVIMAATMALLLLPLLPVLSALLGLLVALVVFARAWRREFDFLMSLGDRAFPGGHDKMIWAMLMIVLPPVGLILFRSYRRAHWPESEASAKPAMPANDLS